jgi:hypothetical protein
MINKYNLSKKNLKEKIIRKKGKIEIHELLHFDSLLLNGLGFLFGHTER